jgi:hypothetical protein
MAQYFTWNWSNGATTNIRKSDQMGFHCDYKQPDNAMQTGANEIVANAGNSTNLNEVEQYCASAVAWIDSLYTASNTILNGWDAMENDCHHWRNWIRWCEDKGRFCYMTENQLETAESKWRAMRTSINASKLAIIEIWQNASTQIDIDGGQATDQAILDQLIAETNNIISINAYQNESRELEVSARKTRDIFLPIIIGIILLGVGFYLTRK